MGLRQLLTPSFRARLRLFFVVIVVVPMITMAVVLYQLIVASESSQTDARLSESQTVALKVYEDEQKEAGTLAERIGEDQQLADALDADDRRAVQQRLDTLVLRGGARVAANLWPDLRPDRTIEVGVICGVDGFFTRFRALWAAQFGRLT